MQSDNKPYAPYRLFTPGPLTTDDRVRQSMLIDQGSREPAFITTTQNIRLKLLEVAQASKDRYTVVPLTGSGTSLLEAALGTFTTSEQRLLIIENGHYGRRLAAIAESLGVFTETLSFQESASIDLDKVTAYLDRNSDFHHVAMVHCETATGVLNPIAPLAKLTAERGINLFLDAMSTFGGIPMDLNALNIGCVVASANKCIEGLPGIAFAIVNKQLLHRSDLQPKSYSLNLVKQWEMLEQTGQFRFTPAVQVMMALDTALDLLQEETVFHRYSRYRKIQRNISAGMSNLGFRCSVDSSIQSPIITSFDYPSAAFDFGRFYRFLAERGLIIYPGKLSSRESFRIGNIGQITDDDVNELIAAVGAYQA